MQKPKQKNQPLAIDIFSGSGGMTTGLKRAGFKVIGAIEIEPLAVETYKRNHKGATVWATDIRNLPVTKVKRQIGLRKGTIDLIAGCPPCEGFSEMRTLKGTKKIKDPRNQLIFEFLRFVRELKPKVVMLENVPGLAKNWRFRKFCSELSALGYDYEFRTFNAADFGVPQRRKRLILLASRVGKINFAMPDPNHRTVRMTIASLPPRGRSGDPLHDFPEKHSKKIFNRIRRVPRNGGSRVDLGKRSQLPCHMNFNGFKDVYGRMTWDDVSPTITGGCVNPSKGRFLHPRWNRAITLREAALLQTFPPKYFISLARGKTRAATLIGDALPPEFIRRHAREVFKHLLNANSLQQ